MLCARVLKQPSPNVGVVALAWLPFPLLRPWLFEPWRDAWRARDARLLWTLATCVLVVLFFTMSAVKRDMYILPALPMLALAAAPFLDGLLERRGVRRALFALADRKSTRLNSSH